VVRRSLKVLNPVGLILVETEIWPNLLREAHRCGIPTLLLSGRLSPRAFLRYRRLRWFFRDVLQNVKVFGMQSEPDGARMIGLGADARRVLVTGNLKQAVPEAKADGQEDLVPGAFKASAPADKPEGWLWVVGSTHPGEEEIVLAAFGHLKKHFPALRMVLAPRHPHRFREVEKLLLAHGWRFEKKSEVNGKLSPERDVMILDTMGDLERFYAVGDVAFVGGSLVDAGGHNLLEPARFRKPVLFGPHTSNVAALAQDLIANGGGIQVRGCDDLVREMTVLLSEPERCKAIGTRAFLVASRDCGVLDLSVEVVARHLEA
jgi:3-deoxy-D-manno-octulosonic-acid transferase